MRYGRRSSGVKWSLFDASTLWYKSFDIEGRVCLLLHRTGWGIGYSNGSRTGYRFALVEYRIMKFMIRGWFVLFLLVGSTLYGQITVVSSADTVEQYGIYELTIRQDGPSYANPWEDVAVWLRLSDSRSPVIDIDG